MRQEKIENKPMQIMITKIPSIRFEGFAIRELLVSDSTALFPTLRDEENGKFTVFNLHTDEEQTARWINGLIQENCFWAITTFDNIAIGFIGYHSVDSAKKKTMISIHLNKAYWGRGITSKAVMSTDRYIYDNTEIELIAATVKPENIQSQRCLTKAGYKLDKVISNYQSSTINDTSKVRYFYTKQKS